MRAWRTALHREPELSNEESRTQAKVVEALGSLGLRAQTYDGFHGVRAVVAPDADGPAVALRADMDALPVTEETGVAYISRFAGRMHACGHDVHMSCLLGAASVLKQHERELRGPVVLLFQPAEEEGRDGGAAPFLERGCFEHPTVDYVVGQHVAPEIPEGRVGWRTGAIMAAADHFRILVQGTGAHAATPHRGPDAIVVASEIVVGLQAIVSRTRDPLDPVVISVGMIHGGTRHNILPGEVRLEGTVRTLKSETRDQMEQRIRQRVRHLAASLGAKARVEYLHGYPVTMNDPKATHRLVAGLSEELGEGALVEIDHPIMGAEDFSRYLERVPGAFLFLGVGRNEPQSLHSPTFLPADSTLVTGATVLVTSAATLQGRP